MKAPLSIICELTHRCPLRCVYCSNPLELAARALEMTTAEWASTMEQAAELGILHAHFTGGEPLARADLNEIVAAARRVGLYSNLITSGIGMTEARLDSLLDAGLDHVQLSFQGRDELQANEIAGARAHAHKLKVAEWIRSRRVAFTVNLVVHRRNLDELAELIAFCASLGPQRLEIANVQYYGWALENRAALMPTREQMERSIRIVENARANSRREAPNRLCATGLLWQSTESLHGRMGQPNADYRPGRKGVAMPCGRRDPRIELRFRTREIASLDLDRLAGDE